MPVPDVAPDYLGGAGEGGLGERGLLSDPCGMLLSHLLLFLLLQQLLLRHFIGMGGLVGRRSD